MEMVSQLRLMWSQRTFRRQTQHHPPHYVFAALDALAKRWKAYKYDVFFAPVSLGAKVSENTSPCILFAQEQAVSAGLQTWKCSRGMFFGQ